jgi:AbrB family looped-hinge helix DNA binding protein
MPLVRKVRARSNSVAVTIPKAIAESLEWSAGTLVEIEVVGRDSLVLRTRREPRATP